MISKQVIAITEKQILHYYSDHPSPDIAQVDFISSIANSFKDVLIELQVEGLLPLREHIIKIAPSSLEYDIIDAILETEYQEDKIEYYKKELQVFKSLEGIRETTLKNIENEISKKSDKDLNKIVLLYEELGKALDNIDPTEGGKEEKPYINFCELVEEHKVVVENRSNEIKQSTGCLKFDSLMPSVYPGISILAGYSGSAKSTFLHYLTKQRLIRRLPTGLINTELAKPSYMDAMISPLAEIPYTDMMGLEFLNDNIDYEDILQKMDTVQKRFKKNNNYLYFNKYNCSVDDLEQFIIFCRKSMNLDKRMTLFVLADLFSMFSDFNKSKSGYNKAEIINTTIDKVNEMCLRENVHLIGSVQLKRPDEVSKIKQVEDVDKFRPTLSEIKSSGGWEERARSVYLIHNPWSIVHKNPCSPIIRDLVPPMIEVTLAKDTYIGNTGATIKYLFLSKYKTFIPFTEDQD